MEIRKYFESVPAVGSSIKKRAVFRRAEKVHWELAAVKKNVNDCLLNCQLNYGNEQVPNAELEEAILQSNKEFLAHIKLLNEVKNRFRQLFPWTEERPAAWLKAAEMEQYSDWCLRLANCLEDKWGRELSGNHDEKAKDMSMINKTENYLITLLKSESSITDEGMEEILIFLQERAEYREAFA